MTYRPLPNCLTIKNSPIEGLGLFATEDLIGGDSLGISHVMVNAEYCRTPLGGFYNHSDTPNCQKYYFSNQFKKWFELVPIRDIKKGEEITVKYTLYKMGNKK